MGITHILLKVLPHFPHATGAEVGVYRGKNSVTLLRLLPGLQHLYCVDPWTTDPSFESASGMNTVEAMGESREKALAMLAPHMDRVSVLAYPSGMAASAVPDASLDFCFIDGNHAYEHVAYDIACWLPKLTSDGILCGHDHNNKHPGVVKAVREHMTDCAYYVENSIWFAPQSLACAQRMDAILDCATR